MEHEEVTHAVRWWTSHLKQPVVHSTGNPETSRRLTEVAAAYPLPDEQSITDFAQSLTGILNEQIERRITYGQWNAEQAGAQLPVRAETWYGPVDLLADAAGPAIHPAHLPAKTVMKIRPGVVYVLSGDRATRHDVWHA